MEQVLIGTVASVGAAVTLIAFIMVYALLFPRLVSQIEAVLYAAPKRSFLIGLVNAIFFVVIALAFADAGDGAQVIGILILFVVSFLASLGLAGCAGMMANRLDGSGTPLRQQVYGTALLALGLLAPIVGWFVLAPVILVAGLGATITALVQRRRASKADVAWPAGEPGADTVAE